MNITLPGKAATLMASQRERADKLRAQHGIEAQSWYRITNATSPDEAEVMLYDEIGGWYGATADQFIADLRGITAPSLRVRVNSPGGSVFEGIAIANALRSHPGNVTIQVDGIAASIASVIAMAGDRIEMGPNTMLMIHDASGLCMGNASDMEEMAELLDLISDNIADAYAARAGGTREQWRERMKAETWYLPDDAVENGLADEAVQVPQTGQPVSSPAEEDDEPDMARAFDLAAYGYQGPSQWAEPEPQPAQVTLTFNLGEAIDEQVFDTLRQMVARHDPAPEVAATASDVAPAADATPAEPAPEEPAVPEPEARAAEPEPVDAWAAAVAGLVTPQPDPWTAAVAHLINSTSASSAATEAA